MKYSIKVLENFINLLNSPAWIKDADGCYLLVNRSFLRFIGMEREEILGRKAHQIFPFAMAEIIENSDLKAIDSKEQIDSEDCFLDANGKQISFESSKTVVTTGQGNVLCTVGIGRNVNKLKQFQQKIAALQAKQDDSDAALRALLDLRERDKKAIENRISEALTESVLPYLQKLQQGYLDSVQNLLLDTVIGNVRSLTATHAMGVANIYLSLTPTEMQIAEFVRKGLTGKEIAEKLGLSPATVNTHRRNMRKRLGLNKQKINLRQYLLEH